MARLFTQLTIKCPNCGEYLWSYKATILNTTTSTEEVTDTDAVCRKCNVKKYYLMLRGADKIVPLGSYDDRDNPTAEP